MGVTEIGKTIMIINVKNVTHMLKILYFTQNKFLKQI